MQKFSKFNKLSIAVCLLIIVLSNFSTVSARERMGGVNGGGGNEVEALFKSKLLELSESLVDFKKDSQEMLGFDPNELYATLNETGGFFSLCATDEELLKIQTGQKMAMVFNDKPGIVYLNCTDYNTEQWKSKLDIDNIASGVFMLHEALRVMDFSGENNYGYSKNYIKAFKNEEKNNYALIQAAINNNTKNGCKIFIEKGLFDLAPNVTVSVKLDGNLIFKKLTGSGRSSDDYKSALFNKHTDVFNEMSKVLISVLKNARCE